MKISNNITTSPNVNITNNRNNTNATKQSFGAKNPANAFNQFFKLEKSGPMTRKLFIANAFTFLLGSRILTSRDKDEKRETIIRDVPTIVISVAGVPKLEKATAKILEKKTGFAITEKFEKAGGKKVAENVNYSTINNWYKYDENLGEKGLEAFTKRLDAMGGNVKKICSSLSDDIKAQVKGFADDNAGFIKNLQENSEVYKNVKEAFAQAGNKAAKKAELLKTGSKFAGFAATLLIVGLIIPKINMLITSAIHKNDTQKSEAKKA